MGSGAGRERRDAEESTAPLVGVVGVPWVGIPPKSQGSVAGKTDRITKLLADRYQFTIVGGVTGRLPAREHPNITYLTAPDTLDRYIDRAVNVVSRTHAYFRRSYHVLYALRAALALRHRGVRVVIVDEFPQWIPILRRTNPTAAVVLWANADSFIEVDRLLPLVRRADALVGASEFLVGRYRARVPELAAATSAVYSAVDTESFHPRADVVVPGRIVYAGRITPEKGLHVLVDAFARLAATHPQLELVLAGPPWVTDPSLLQGVRAEHLPGVVALANDRYRAELARRAGPHGDRLHFKGVLSTDALVELLQSADVFCHPGFVQEGFCGAVAEALACGTPVIASDQGAPADYVEDPGCGRIVPAGETEALVDALVELIDDPGQRSTMARRARELAVERLSTEEAAESLARVLDAAVAASERHEVTD